MDKKDFEHTHDEYVSQETLDHQYVTLQKAISEMKNQLAGFRTAVKACEDLFNILDTRVEMIEEYLNASGSEHKSRAWAAKWVPHYLKEERLDRAKKRS